MPEPCPPSNAPAGRLEIGPLRCAWLPYRRGTPAESLALPWLAAELGVAPDAVGLWRDAYGRPHLGHRHAGFDANWSHSGEALLVTLGAGVRVGVDIEFHRPRPGAMALAERFFTPAEAAALVQLPPARAETAFVQLWCAKEAVLKAHGRGIAFGLERLAFTPVDDGWQLTATDPALGHPEDWSLHAFSPMPGYLATLAWRSP